MRKPLVCWGLIAVLAVAVVLGAVPGARARDDGEFNMNPDVTWVDRFRYDPRHQTITLPVTGILPSLAWSNSPQSVRFKVAYVDVPGLGTVPSHLRAGAQRRFPQDRLIQLIMTMEPTPGKVRLVVRGTRPLHLTPRLVPYRGGWAVQIKVRPAKLERRR